MTDQELPEAPYKKVFDPIKEGNPAQIINPNNVAMWCIGGCNGMVDSADGLCTDCWMYRHDARLIQAARKGEGE